MPVALGGAAVCDDGGQSGRNRLDGILADHFRAERIGGGMADFADVVLRHAYQHRVRHAGGMGIGAL